MTNPYAAPSTDAALSADKPSRRLVLASGALGIAWWLALLIPEESRSMLLPGTTLDVVWGFVRVVAIVGTACLLFRRLGRAWPSSTLAALVCYWSGCGLFALSTAPANMPWSASVVIVGPPVFALVAWYVVIPMTTLTALVLVHLDAKPRRSG